MPKNWVSVQQGMKTREYLLRGGHAGIGVGYEGARTRLVAYRPKYPEMLFETWFSNLSGFRCLRR